MNEDFIKNLKLIAMFSVVKKPADYMTRKIFRWFSNEFATPLHVVETLPLEDVLTHYFESMYEDLDPEEREDLIERLLMDPDKLAALQRAEDAEDADAWEFGREVADQAPPIKMAEVPVDPITERIEKLKAEIRPPEKLDGPETSLPKIEEGIHIKFEDLDAPEFDDAPSFGPKPG